MCEPAGAPPVAGMIHAVAILLAMIAAAPAAEALALPALAGLLIVTAWSMSEPHRWPDRLALPRTDLALMLLTISLTVLADLTVAIGVGTGIGLALRLPTRDPEPPAWHPSERDQVPNDAKLVDRGA